MSSWDSQVRLRHTATRNNVLQGDLTAARAVPGVREK